MTSQCKLTSIIILSKPQKLCSSSKILSHPSKNIYIYVPHQLLVFHYILQQAERLNCRLPVVEIASHYSLFFPGFSPLPPLSFSETGLWKHEVTPRLHIGVHMLLQHPLGSGKIGKVSTKKDHTINWEVNKILCQVICLVSDPYCLSSWAPFSIFFFSFLVSSLYWIQVHDACQVTVYFYLLELLQAPHIYFLFFWKKMQKRSL